MKNYSSFIGKLNNVLSTVDKCINMLKNREVIDLHLINNHLLTSASEEQTRTHVCHVFLS